MIVLFHDLQVNYFAWSFYAFRTTNWLERIIKHTPSIDPRNNDLC